MPELPEVETVRRGLEPVLAGARLSRVEPRRPDLRFPFPEDFVQRLTGARIERMERRAKYLLAPLDRGDVLVMHLGMSGRFEIEGADRTRPGAFRHKVEADEKHAHVLFETETGARVTYYDPRRFGFMGLIGAGALAEHPWFAEMGPEPLSADFNADLLKAAFKGRKQSPKTLLLDQRVVAGLGNIYVCEALYRAGIAPTRAAGRISVKRIEALVPIIKTVLEEAIISGGSTLRDYAAADGALGYFQHNFRVYGREGQPCPTCGTPIRRDVQGGRSTFWCLNCQG